MDGKGNHFSATKKMWFDGKHWWKGRWAWLFVNGVWYCGNSPWTQTASGWTTTERVYRPECVDCGGGPSKVAALVPPHAVGPAGTAKKPITVVKPPCVQPKPTGTGPAADAGAQPQPDEPAATAGSDQAQQEPAAAGIPGSAPQGCKPGNGTETGTDGATAKIDPATGEATVQPMAMPAGTTVSPPVAGPSSRSPTATECRQFVPAIGMTIEVPCGSGDQ